MRLHTFESSEFISAVASLGLAAFLSVSVSGCQDSSVERVSVRGRVTLDGAPLQAAGIVFRDLGDSGISAFGEVQDGYYEIELDRGPAAGTARVEFVPKPLPREELEGMLDENADDRLRRRRQRRPVTPTVMSIPAKYTQDSPLQVDLRSGDVNQHDFDLDSQASR